MSTAQIIWDGDLETKCTHLKSGDTITTDAPTDNEGKGAHFSPTDLLATSLVSCMLTIVAIRARKENWKIEKMTGDLKKVMASDPRRVSETNIQIKVKGDLSDKEKRRLEAAAKNCPVAKSLHPDLKQIVTFSYI